jgi:hypothetical protein
MYVYTQPSAPQGHYSPENPSDIAKLTLAGLSVFGRRLMIWNPLSVVHGALYATQHQAQDAHYQLTFRHNVFGQQCQEMPLLCATWKPFVKQIEPLSGADVPAIPGVRSYLQVLLTPEGTKTLLKEIGVSVEEAYVSGATFWRCMIEAYQHHMSRHSPKPSCNSTGTATISTNDEPLDVTLDGLAALVCNATKQ